MGSRTGDAGEFAPPPTKPYTGRCETSEARRDGPGPGTGVTTIPAARVIARDGERVATIVVRPGMTTELTGLNAPRVGTVVEVPDHLVVLPPRSRAWSTQWPITPRR